MSKGKKALSIFGQRCWRLYLHCTANVNNGERMSACFAQRTHVQTWTSVSPFKASPRGYLAPINTYDWPSRCETSRLEPLPIYDASY